MSELPNSLLHLIDQETNQPADPAIHRIAEAACQRATQGRPDAVLSVLFYGSCLRSGVPHDSLVDLYLLVDSYDSVHAGTLMRHLNRLLPPNVYYIEIAHEGRTVRAKYAVMTLDQFARRVGPAGFHPYFWARFAQPTGILAARDEESRQETVAALARATVTLARAARGLFGQTPPPEVLWTRAFAETYRTELRAEDGGRARQLYDRYGDRYDRIWECLQAEGLLSETLSTSEGARRWLMRRLAGKLLSVLRLAKAAFTFTDGQAYLLWKIERHSGVRVAPTAWQKRHPLLSAPILAWRLYRRGGFR
ncbi:hypothetical protein ACFOW6_04455 [Fodinicurvata halophila]|uniref:Phosphatidate cytidylyltransferase n=1 Tax=Fodinicurvata halophila TaxID=1419723 RepID=A0ABV8UJF4_9PROT